MKVLITGGAGYIGFSLTRLLASQEAIEHIYIYDNLSRKNYSFFNHLDLRGGKVTFISGDILDGRKLKKVLRNVDTVVHLAAKVTTPFADHDAHAFDQVNHWGTAQMVLAAEHSNVQNFINLSSSSIYGSTKEEVDESYTPHPHSFYGISKLAGENQVNYLKSIMRVFNLRSANVYGYNPAYRIDSVINRFMFGANFNKKITIEGGDQARAFIHVDKLAFTIGEILNGKIGPGTYNIAEHNFTVKEIVQVISQIFPDTESLTVNENMPRRHIRLKTPTKISGIIPLPSRSFKEELEDFKNHFSF